MTRKEKGKAAIKTAALFAVAFLAVLAGCRNSYSPPTVAPATEGSVKLALGLSGTRTIQPDTTIGDFEKFVFSFKSADPLEKPFEFEVDKGTTNKTVQLEVGTYDLQATAFLDWDANNKPQDDAEALKAAAAVYVQTGITVTSGGTPVTINVLFGRIMDPATEGEFSWDITIDAGANVKAAELTVLNKSPDQGGTPVTIPGGGNPVTLATTGGTGSMLLPSGNSYWVRLELDNGNEKVPLGEALHLYQNTTSTWTKTIKNTAFPETFLDYLLASWNASTGKWDFAARGITAGDFADADIGISGVDSLGNAEFVKFTELMGDITKANTKPTDKATLADLVDLTLVWYAKENGDFEISELDVADTALQAALQTQLTSYVANNPGTFTVKADITTKPDVIDVTLTSETTTGTGYEWLWTIKRLDGVVKIDATPDGKGWYRVGDDLKVNTANLTGKEGNLEYRWMRSNSASGNTAADIADKGDLIEDRPAATATYTPTDADLKAYVTAVVYSIGAFGQVVANDPIGPNAIGPIESQPETGNITIDLEDLDGLKTLKIEPVVIKDPINHPYPDVTLESVKGSSITGVKWFVNEIEVPGSSGNKLSIPLDRNVHGETIGTHYLVVVATINGDTYSLEIEFDTVKVKP